MSDKVLPFKFYNVKNMGNETGLVYVGKVSDADPEISKQFPEEYYAECFTTFTFASIVPGRNILIDPATEIDPSILVDAKWFDFRPKNFASNDVGSWPYNTVLLNVDYSDAAWTNPKLKSIGTDGTITINGLESNFTWSDLGATGDKNFDTFVFQAPKYGVKNVGEPGPFYGLTGIPGKTDVDFYFKSLIGKGGIIVDDYGDTLMVRYVLKKIPGSNCDFCAGPDQDIICEPIVPASIGQVLT